MKIFNLTEAIDDNYDIVKGCLDYLLRNGGPDITNGKHILDKEGVFVNVSEYVTKPQHEGMWEAHKKYADFHLVLKGVERICVSQISDMKVEKYDSEQDNVPCCGQTDTSCVLDENSGILLMPEDAHMPGVNVDTMSLQVKKAVFKIPISYFER